jgi:hypothetical protein
MSVGKRSLAWLLGPFLVPAVIVGFLARDVLLPPVPEHLLWTDTAPVHNEDLWASARYENVILVPPGQQRDAQVELYVWPLRKIKDYDVVVLSPSGTESVTVGGDRTMAGPRQVGEAKLWTGKLSIWHDGLVSRRKGGAEISGEKIEVKVRYSAEPGEVQLGPPEGDDREPSPSAADPAYPTSDPEGPPQELAVPAVIRVTKLDFPPLPYLFMIMIGITLSYIFGGHAPKLHGMVRAAAHPVVPAGADQQQVTHEAEVRATSAAAAHGGSLFLSLVVAPALYVQFSQAAPLTDWALGNLLLAIPFGAGVDYALVKAGGARTSAP